MLDRYRAALALTSLCLLAASASHHRHARHARPPAAAAARASVGVEIYSRRALRRARTILQLKLMELRALQLERIRKAIERVLEADQPHP